jgi:translation elongation factor EF-Ts
VRQIQSLKIIIHVVSGFFIRISTVISIIVSTTAIIYMYIQTVLPEKNIPSTKISTKKKKQKQKQKPKNIVDAIVKGKL